MATFWDLLPAGLWPTQPFIQPLDPTQPSPWPPNEGEGAGRPRVGLAAWNDPLPTQAIGPASTPLGDKLFGLHGHERYQFFPERLLRSIYEGLQHDPWDPQTGTFTPQAIGTAMDFAMLGSGGAPFRPAPAQSFGMAAARSAKLPMDTASRMARADAMGFRQDMPAMFGTAPEGEKIASAAINANGKIYTGATHGEAIVRAEEGEGVQLGHMILGPIPDGFVTDAGRYVSRREAADIAAHTGQGQARGRWGATRGLASEDITPASGPSRPTRVQTAATAPGIPGGSGVWGVLGPRGAEGTAPLQPGETVLWHRAQRPGKFDARNLEDYEIRSSLQNAWEQGHDAVTMTSYTRPHGTKPETILVVRDPNQLRSPGAAFNPAKRNSANLLASLLGAGVLGPSISSATLDPTSLPIPQPKPPVF